MALLRLYTLKQAIVTNFFTFWQRRGFLSKWLFSQAQILRAGSWERIAVRFWLSPQLWGPTFSSSDLNTACFELQAKQFFTEAQLLNCWSPSIAHTIFASALSPQISHLSISHWFHHELFARLPSRLPMISMGISERYKAFPSDNSRSLSPGSWYYLSVSK